MSAAVVAVADQPETASNVTMLPEAERGAVLAAIWDSDLPMHEVIILTSLWRGATYNGEHWVCQMTASRLSREGFSVPTVNRALQRLVMRRLEDPIGNPTIQLCQSVVAGAFGGVGGRASLYFLAPDPFLERSYQYDKTVDGPINMIRPTVLSQRQDRGDGPINMSGPMPRSDQDDKTDSQNIIRNRARNGREVGSSEMKTLPPPSSEEYLIEKWRENVSKARPHLRRGSLDAEERQYLAAMLPWGCRYFGTKDWREVIDTFINRWMTSDWLNGVDRECLIRRFGPNGMELKWCLKRFEKVLDGTYGGETELPTPEEEAGVDVERKVAWLRLQSGTVNGKEADFVNHENWVSFMDAIRSGMQLPDTPDEVHELCRSWLESGGNHE